MNDEEIFQCYQIWKEYRRKRQEFNREMEQWFETHSLGVPARPSG